MSKARAVTTLPNDWQRRCIYRLNCCSTTFDAVEEYLDHLRHVLANLSRVPKAPPSFSKPAVALLLASEFIDDLCMLVGATPGLTLLSNV